MSLLSRSFRLLSVCAVSAAFLCDTPGADAENRHDSVFQSYFTRLYANRDIYEQYNDSILADIGRDEWMNLFDRRAKTFKHLYGDNVSLYYEMGNYLRNRPDSNARYDAFLHAFTNFNGHGTQPRGNGEPFARAAIAKTLLDHYGTLASRGTADTADIVYLDLQLALQQYNISRLADTAALNRAWEYSRDAFVRTDHVNPGSSPAVRSARINAVNNMCASQWLTNRKTDYGEYTRHLSLLRSILGDSLMTRGCTPSSLRLGQNRLRRERWNTIRSLYLLDRSSVPPDVADSAITEQIKHFEAEGDKITVTDFVRLRILRIEKDLCTPVQAWRECIGFYKNKPRPRVVNFAQLHGLYPAINDLAYINDIADFSPGEKHDNALSLRDEALELFQNKTEAVHDHSFMMVLGFFISYERLLKYLTVEEKTAFVHGLIMRTQICTYAHMANVASMAATVMEAVMKYRPDLVPDVPLPCDPVEYARRAAFLHDWGKARLAPLVANDFRRLNDNEISLIKTHPARGYEMLSTDSAFIPYRDIALGHHRWYDGTGGYPAHFDNTSSSVRFYIDLVTLCDCLEAGTDPVGRNYFLRKPFDQMFYEMRLQAGTRYNPDIIGLIDAHEDVCDALRRLSDSNRRDAYFEIYNLLHGNDGK